MTMPETDASVETIIDAAVPADPISSSNAADALTNALCGYSERCDLIALLELVINEPCADFVKAQFEDGTLSSWVIRSQSILMTKGWGIVSKPSSCPLVMLICLRCFRRVNLPFRDSCPKARPVSLPLSVAATKSVVLMACVPAPVVRDLRSERHATPSMFVRPNCFASKMNASPTPNGGNCGDDFPACASGSFCKVEATFAGTRSRCERLNTQTVGMNATCDLNGGPFCESGLSCVAQPGFLTVEFKCRPPVTPGQTCFAGAPDQCPAGYFCDGFNLDVDVTNLDDLDVEGDCIELPNAGDACATSLVGEICNVGLVCTDGVCESRVRLGESCTADAMCYSGACRNDVCTVPRSPLCE